MKSLLIETRSFIPGEVVCLRVVEGGAEKAVFVNAVETAQRLMGVMTPVQRSVVIASQFPGDRDTSHLTDLAVNKACLTIRQVQYAQSEGKEEEALDHLMQAVEDHLCAYNPRDGLECLDALLVAAPLDAWSTDLVVALALGAATRKKDLKFWVDFLHNARERVEKERGVHVAYRTLGHLFDDSEESEHS